MSGATVSSEIAAEKHTPDAGSRVSPSGVTTSAATPLSFVVGVTDIEILQNNFMASPCVAEVGSPHEVILVRGGPNVTAKLSRGLEQAEHDWVVCIDQDVLLGAGLQTPSECPTGGLLPSGCALTGSMRERPRPTNRTGDLRSGTRTGS